jgi:hypothetical protein
LPRKEIHTKVINVPLTCLDLSPATTFLLERAFGVAPMVPIHHERYWPDPWALKPDRWMGTIGATPNARSNKKVVSMPSPSTMRYSLKTVARALMYSDCVNFLPRQARRKFTQSEYISALATVLREYRIVLGEGMDAKVVKSRLSPEH